MVHVEYVLGLLGTVHRIDTSFSGIWWEQLGNGDFRVGVSYPLASGSEESSMARTTLTGHFVLEDLFKNKKNSCFQRSDLY